MKKSLSRAIGLLLSLAMILIYSPATMVWALDDGSVTENQAEVSETTETSASALSDAESQEKLDKHLDSKLKLGAGDATVSCSDNGHGTVSFSNGKVTATPAQGYDLATIRAKYSSGKKDEYLHYSENEKVYTADFEPTEDCTIMAFFMNENKWDGAVDVTWYDPSQESFDISTPAQLAGLAAIVNGMVDEKNTEEWMIKDNDGRTFKDNKYYHKYISTYADVADLLTPNSGASVRDTVWRTPERTESLNILGTDDDRNDFKYRTINIVSDLDMTGTAPNGSQLNWTPIGGKYAMDCEEKNDSKKVKVIDTRFQGVFDGNGHTIEIECNRFSKMGYAYSWNVALIGFLGGGIDYLNGYPKDTYIEFANEWVPTARNIVLKGSVHGRRIVGGVVGRTGETNYGVLVEKCVNYARVSATDMRGCAGIVGAAWGQATIRNCYNAGEIESAFGEHGGIIGSNGYEGSGSYEGREDFQEAGANIYNCYNIGTTTLNGVYDGQEIGVDGDGFAKYTVANCYYLKPEKTQDSSGYSRGSTTVNTKVKCKNVTAVEDMNSSEVINKLNQNGNVFVEDTDGINSDINGGGPVLYFQTNEYKETKPITKSNITICPSANGSIAASKTSDITYGTTINLSNTGKNKYRLKEYEVSDNGENKVIDYGDFYTLTGHDVTITGEFELVPDVEITFIEQSASESPYYATVTKIDPSTGKTLATLSSNSTVKVGDRIKVVPSMKKQFWSKGKQKWEAVHPDLKSLEYTGELGSLKVEKGQEAGLSRVSALDKTYEVTGECDTIDIKFAPKTQGKRWTSIADTTWYKSGQNTFEISNAKQLAGMAVLAEDQGITFSGVTIKLTKDIDLSNTFEKSGDEYPSPRSWIGIGTDRCPFQGTFDGQGHTIKHMYRNFYSGYCPGQGGLFAATKNAKISNVNIDDSSYMIKEYNEETQKYTDVELSCGFINGTTGGGIVAEAVNTTISNCNVTLSMNSAKDGTGGIVGTLEGKSTITSCKHNGTIAAKEKNVGGIVGKLNGATSSIISNCINDGKITSERNNVGGILGYADASTAQINSCVNKAKLEFPMLAATRESIGSAGGIVGRIEGDLSCNKDANMGSINASKTAYSIGGVVGSMEKGTLTDCYNSGNISFYSSKNTSKVAGVANIGNDSIKTKSTITNCYNSGIITLEPGCTTPNYGGVIGYGTKTNNVIKNSYCTVSSVANIGSKVGIAGTVVADETFKTYASKLGSSFTTDVDKLNKGFPILKHQCQHSYEHYHKNGGNCVTGYDYDGCTKCGTKINYKTIAGYSTSYVKSFKLSAGKKCFTAKWKKQSKSTQKKFSGYQIQYSKYSNYSSAKTTTAGKSKSSKKISKLTSKKKYYVRIRTYRTKSGVKYYSKWTKKSVKVK